MKQQLHNLAEELQLAGASDAEVTSLLPIATDLTLLAGAQSSRAQTVPRRRSKWPAFWPAGLTSLAGLALGMVLVIASQTVLPGSLLYPVQKFSDNVSLSVDPSYRGTVMMKRAQEVKQLIAEHASSKVVLATLADYRTEAIAYRSAPANYAVFEYCKANLQQAAALAPSAERQAIHNALSSLKSI